MPAPSGRRHRRDSHLSDALSRADLAAEFLARNRTYRAEYAQIRGHIASGDVATAATEAAFARRWGLSFRRITG